MDGSSKLPGSSGALAFVAKLLRTQPDSFLNQKRTAPGCMGINNSGNRIAIQTPACGQFCESVDAAQHIVAAHHFYAPQPLVGASNAPGKDNISQGSASHASSRITWHGW